MLPSLYIYRLINPSADGDWHEKPSSTAAFSSSVIDDDSALPFHEHAHLNHAPHPFRPLLCILGYLLAGTAIVATAVFIVIHSARGPSPIPVFPTQTLIFHQEPAYAAPASPSSDALWNANLPGGKGFVLLEDAGKYGLPPGLPSAGGNATGVYGVTWTHEYHCLKLIRMEFWNALDGTSQLYGGDKAQPPLDVMDVRRLHHVQHCMDYIRQLIMCRADMTVEWAAPYPDALGNEHHIDGYSVPHTCTNWDNMYDYMIANQPRRHQQHDH
ncbi:MAG: hypothetical protein ASARMPRED_002780 [Alectoria sarmentosa]|nr:MAG: hypothetical protein ASARMPRED_002780 [Alectoria sarmentosa]